MAGFYIISVDSFQDAFSRIDATKTCSFDLKIQNNEDVLGSVGKGDSVLIYRKSPMSGVNVYMTVLERNGERILLRKNLEVSTPISVDITGVEDNYLTTIQESKFKEICKKMLLQIEDALQIKEDSTPNDIKVDRKTGAENVLLYGVPGVGKSHEIQEKYCDDDTRMERVVFHPDYTYSDFVGQILPRVVDGQLKYVFTPGPFTKILKKAWENPEKEYYLIIEEINRGNAPAIFGEIFQLLDRKSEDAHKFSPSEYGESEYAITNYDVADVVYGEEEHSIRIPSNMWILATMNTADQNVFTLDTAFQRRWNMKQMRNNVMAAGHARDKIEGSEIQWGAFALVINDMVTEINVDIASSEDKRLGAYFVKHAELSSKKFPEKVLKYLWDDAFKMDKESVFDEKFKSLERVIETYEESETDKLRAVLRADVYQKMLNRMAEETSEN